MILTTLLNISPVRAQLSHHLSRHLITRHPLPVSHVRAAFPGHHTRLVQAIIHCSPQKLLRVWNDFGTFNIQEWKPYKGTLTFLGQWVGHHKDLTRYRYEMHEQDPYDWPMCSVLYPSSARILGSLSLSSRTRHHSQLITRATINCEYLNFIEKIEGIWQQNHSRITYSWEFKVKIADILFIVKKLKNIKWIQC